MDSDPVEMATKNALEVQFENLPEVFKDKYQFVAWKYELDDSGDLKKPPFSPKTGRRASVRNRATWGSLDDARRAYETGRYDIPPKYAGIGIVLTGGIVGFDLDHCLIDGKLSPLAEWFLKALPTYTEKSPSGTGWRMFVEGYIPGPFRRTRHGIEVYDALRYLTLTGYRVEDTPQVLLNDQRRLNVVYRKIFEKEVQINEATQTLRAPKRQIKGVRLNLPDSTVLEKALNAKNGRDFARYYYGDASLWEGGGARFDSQSEADLALVYRLLYWTNGDTMQTDRLFRLSGLMRAKWDRVVTKDGKTYGKETIDKALPAYLAQHPG